MNEYHEIYTGATKPTMKSLCGEKDGLKYEISINFT